MLDISDLGFSFFKLGEKSFKVHCHAIQCFMSIFLRSKMAARRLEAAALANEWQARRPFFFFNSAVRSFNRLTSENQSVTDAKWFFSRTKSGHEN